ncbi:acyltransferase [Prescottella equi]|uniref:WS/DGAT domain-containing protein n=1 Tax=Rhodococcus hoagii TaxID=43767 RepID=UPI0009C0D482|nr:WS/DGAT domain-containing protein [Prescottella equi]MBM4727167.1 DUF1298 domain-containing protein [Prescottella equi]OQQ23922.1 acyltransferase [Prescottella equi]OQQ34640.1 acyltransferase [Prescottella equi]
MAFIAPARLSAADTIFYLWNRPTMVGVLVFEDTGGIGQAEVERWIAQRLDRSPILTHRLAPAPWSLDHPRWVPGNVDVARHVSVEQHTDSGWETLGEKLVQMTADGLPPNMPPWRASVFTGVTGVDGFPDRAVVFALRLHHSVTDGLGFVHLLRSLFGESATTQWRFGRSVPWWLAAPVRLPALLARTGRVGVRQWAAARRADDVPMPAPLHPRTRFNGRADGGRAHRFLNLTVGEAKSTAKALGEYTINELLVAVVAGAQRAYLVEAGELPAASLAAHVPLSLRAGGPPVGNQIVSMIVDLHTDLEDRCERLAAISDSAGRERGRAERSGSDRMQILDSLPAPLLRRLTAPSARPDADTEVIGHPNTIVSNVPRGAADLEFLGIPVHTTVSVGDVIDGRGVGHVATSIGDALTLSVSCDTGMLSDIDHYMDLLAKEYAAFRALT